MSAKTRNKTNLDQLIEKGYIEPYHAEYGLTFTVLREVWLGKLSASTAMLSDQIRSQCPQNSPSDVYDHVRALLKPVQRRIILWSTLATPQPINASVGAVCHNAFERLAQAFTDTHKVLEDKKTM